MSRADGERRRKVAREKYKPKRIRSLLIAEAPPSDDRYFYFEDVAESDWLFLGIMKALLPREIHGYNRDPAWKAKLLTAFQADGFWLLDCVDAPLIGAPTKTKRRAEYLRQRSDLIRRIAGLQKTGDIDSRTPIILVKANVYVAFFAPLSAAGYNVVDEQIPFPSSGRQGEFAVRFPHALSQAGVTP